MLTVKIRNSNGSLSCLLILPVANVKQEHQNHDIEPGDYTKALPYIPPNLTNLRAMKMLMLDHKCLIDQASSYFSVEELREKLYELKSQGPNPLLNVLMAMGRAEVCRLHSD